MVLSRSSSRVAAGLLALAAVVSACSLGDGWNIGFHPFALLAALQLAAQTLPEDLRFSWRLCSGAFRCRLQRLHTALQG